MSSVTSFTGFQYPTSYDDERWKWREILQKNKTSKKQINNSVAKCVCEPNTSNSVNLAKRKQCLHQVFTKNSLKFGCPLHDLMAALLKSGMNNISNDISQHCFCNGYSLNCPITNEKNDLINQLISIKAKKSKQNHYNHCNDYKVSFFDLGLTDDDIKKNKTNNTITINAKIIDRSINNNEKSFSVTFDIMRYLACLFGLHFIYLFVGVLACLFVYLDVLARLLKNDFVQEYICTMARLKEAQRMRKTLN